MAMKDSDKPFHPAKMKKVFYTMPMKLLGLDKGKKKKRKSKKEEEEEKRRLALEAAGMSSLGGSGPTPPPAPARPIAPPAPARRLKRGGLVTRGSGKEKSRLKGDYKIF